MAYLTWGVGGAVGGAGARSTMPSAAFLRISLLNKEQDNVTLQDEPIQEIVETGIRSLTKTEEFDIIVCATGFDISFIPGWKVVGQNGISLAEPWKDAPEAYFGVFAANMPNFLTVNGPNTPLAHGSLLAVMSFTVDYIARWIRKTSTQNIK
jgi:cation diffusion facilitator CzcD-associated flavoprotein CzcO